MTSYRLYVFSRPRAEGQRGRIERVLPLDGDDDRHACAQCEQQRDGQYMELWDKGRLVKAFEPSR